jgi:hypothetical protein
VDSSGERIVALIGEPDRLRVFAALALGAPTVADIARMTSLDLRAVEKALSRLVAGDLVTATDGVYRLVTEDILSAAREAAARRPVEDPDAPPAVAEILRRFMRNGRLARIPMTRSKRLVVLDYLVQNFEPGRRYAEKAVNEMLREFHDDVASLRRYMVDEGLLDREAGEYWRAGGTVEV